MMNFEKSMEVLNFKKSILRDAIDHEVISKEEYTKRLHEIMHELEDIVKRENFDVSKRI